MKILARETPIRPIPRKGKPLLLKNEAAAVLRLMHRGVVREIYFNEHHEAIMIMESHSRRDAATTLQTLPLVKGGFIEFEITELRPYTGFARLAVKK